MGGIIVKEALATAYHGDGTHTMIWNFSIVSFSWLFPIEDQHMRGGGEPLLVSSRYVKFNLIIRF
jgi:hypothetical protein